MIRAIAALALLAPLTAGCGGAGRARPSAIVETPPPPKAGWKAIANDADADRVAGLDAALTHAAAALPRALKGKLAAEGPLLEAGAAQTLPQLPPGPYHCRLLRFGGAARFRAFPPDFCYVTDGPEGLAFTKQTGSTLPSGWIYPDTPTRQVFLGSFRSGTDKQAQHYGADGGIDVAGAIERVSPFRWRLILTRSAAGAALDLYELVPVTPAVPGAKMAVPSS